MITVRDVVDVGFGCSCWSSSGVNENLKAFRLQPSLKPGGYFFHTTFEQDPWLIIDLGCLRYISNISIYNREESGLEDRIRATPISIDESKDGHNFSSLLHYTKTFGGRLTGEPLRLVFLDRLQTRYIKIRLERADFFHLDYVEILSRAPPLRNGIAVDCCRDGDRMSCEYVHQGNSGLYSALSTALSDIGTLSAAGIDVRRIDFGMSFLHFKVKSSENVYNKLFEHKCFRPFDEIGPASFSWTDVHRRYKDLELSKLREVAVNFFEPSKLLASRADTMRRQLSLDMNKTIAIIYRGTDKSTEVKLATPGAYIDVARRLLKIDADLRVVVQTDDMDAQTEICKAFGSRCSYFDQLPVSSGDQAIHLDFERVATEKTGDKDNWTLNMMAAAVLLSESKYLITHTGNVSAWMCFYRGTIDGVYQFDEAGCLVEPDNHQ